MLFVASIFSSNNNAAPSVKLATPTLTLSAIGDATITATVGAVASAGSYVVERSENALFTSFDVIYSSASAGAVADVGLDKGTPYFYRARAITNGVLETSDYAWATNSTTGTFADSDFVVNHGGQAYMKRFWNAVVTGDTIRVPGATFTGEIVGKKVCLKQSDNTSVIPLNIATYATITALISSTEFETDTVFDVDVTNGTGYIFVDNSAAYNAARAAAQASGTNWRVSVPAAAEPYVILDTTVTLNGGGLVFKSTASSVAKNGSATFKFWREGLDVDTYLFGGANTSTFGNYTYGFKNINVCFRDNYGYKITDACIFKLPSGTALRPKFILYGCNVAAEYATIQTDALAWCTTTFGDTVANDKFEELFNCASAKICSYGSSGASGAQQVTELRNVNFHYGMFYTVMFTTYNTAGPGDRMYFYAKDVTFYGTRGSLRGGLYNDDPVKVTMDVTEDIDGDSTIATIRPDSIRNYIFKDLINSNYDHFSRKRWNSLSYTFKFSSGGTTVKTGLILQNNIKPRDRKCVKVGVVTHVFDRGNGIYDILIDKDDACDQAALLTASGGFERLNGVTQADYIGSDDNGSLENVVPNGSNSLVNTMGQMRDYRGFVRWCFGDSYTGDGALPANLTAWSSTASPSTKMADTQIFLEDDSLEGTITIGTVLAGIDASTGSWCTVTVTSVRSFAGHGTWITATQPSSGTMYQGKRIAHDSEIRLTNSAGTLYGTNKFGLNIQTSPKKTVYPNTQPFVVGETLYAYTLGTGTDAGDFESRLGPDFIQLGKWDALPEPTENLTLDYFYKGAQVNATHIFYGKTNPVQIYLENCDYGGGDLVYFWRDIATNSGYRQIFKNCNLPLGGIQGGGEVEVDGGTFYSVGGSGTMYVKNKPKLLGTTSFAKIDESGHGWCENGTPAGGATTCL